MVLNPLLRVPQDFRQQFFLLCSLANIGTIPLILLPALARESPDTFGDGAEALGLPYALISGCLWAWASASIIFLLVKDNTPDSNN